MTKKLISAPETFRRFEISTGTGYKAIKDGTLPVEAIRVGGQWKFRAADVDRIINGPIRHGIFPKIAS
jgi:predicted DNA-binding transcriptional regulator AlpA